ncbi:2-aminoadipate transaminase [compost metagenome]
MELLDICDRNGIPIIEDDSAGTVPFVEAAKSNHSESSNRASSLYGLRQEGQFTGTRVIRIASFESTLCPSRPISWIVADPFMIEQAGKLKNQNEKGFLKGSLDRDMMNQRALYALLNGRVNKAAREAGEIRSFCWRSSVLSVEASYATRRKLMLELLRECEWEECNVQDPGGGLYLWVSLPSGLSSEALKRAAMLKGVTFLPGSFCYATLTGLDSYSDEIIHESIRLNFAAQSEERLRRGMSLLGEAITEFTARSGY